MIESERAAEKTCRVCSSKDITPFFETPPLPIHCNRLWPTRNEAVQAPTGVIKLAFCRACGHIFNLQFNPGRIDYSSNYENSLHFSARFQQYAVSLATRLIERYNLHGKTIIEIGCGKGEFLTLLCELGGNRGVGFDPGCIPNPSSGPSGDRIIFIQDLYSDRYGDYRADFICCRQVLEHLPNPYKFGAMLRRTIGDQRNTGICFEVPNALLTIRGLAIWDIIYEHCSYFSNHSLARLFTECGFNVCNLTETFDDQFLCIEGIPGQDLKNSIGHYGDTLEMMAHDVAAFAVRYRDAVEIWHRKIEQLGRRGRRAVVWGAGSKGVTFLNTLKAQDQIQYVVDINPRKQGMYLAGTGQRIVPPEFLLSYQPDVVIVMNGIYEPEIQGFLKEIGLRASCETASGSVLSE